MTTPSIPPAPQIAPRKVKPNIVQRLWRSKLGLVLGIGIGIVATHNLKDCGQSGSSVSQSRSDRNMPGKKRVNRIQQAFQSAGEVIDTEIYDCRQAMNLTLAEEPEGGSTAPKANAERLMASTVSVEIINSVFSTVNAPRQVRELEGAASMTCWKVIEKAKGDKSKSKVTTKPRTTPDAGEPAPVNPESIRKIMVLPPTTINKPAAKKKGGEAESSASEEKQPPSPPWDFFYVVDGITVSNVQIQPNVGEPVDTFMKRAMTTLHMCTFEKELCDEFDKGKKVESDQDRFKVQQVYVPEE